MNAGDNTADTRNTAASPTFARTRIASRCRHQGGGL